MTSSSARPGQFREHGYIRYRLACCFAQLGETERGLAELRAAVEAMPVLAERAAADERLDPLRDLDGWPLQD